MKRRFWFWCPHEFSFPLKSSDGNYYQVCTRCGSEYGYDWRRMKRTKPLPCRVQQTSLDPRRPDPRRPDPRQPEPPTVVAAKTQAAPPATRSQQAPVPPIGSAAKRFANAAESWAAAARRWGLSGRWQIRLAPVAALAVALAFTFFVVHRSGRAIPVPKSSEVAAPVEVAANFQTSIPMAVSNKTAPVAPRTASETNHRGGGTKLKRISAAPRLQTPVLVVGEALVSSQPDGAQVRFDGSSDPVFVTPAVVGSIPPGHHSVVFSKPGFVPQTVTLEVVAGARSTLNARLVRIGSIFNISSNPAGAAILLDGKSTALTSPAELRVDASGSHTITLVQSGYLSAQSPVSIKDGETFSLAFTLIPAGNAANSKLVGGIKRLLPGGSSKEMAEVQFKTNPKGARLMLNGWSAPKTTPLQLRLPPGGYDVIIEADGFKRCSKEIILEAGQKVVLQEALERSTGPESPVASPGDSSH